MSIKLEIGQTDQLLLSFKYDEEIIKKVKTIKGCACSQCEAFI